MKNYCSNAIEFKHLQDVKIDFCQLYFFERLALTCA
jgi:hypothetical protein